MKKKTDWRLQNKTATCLCIIHRQIYDFCHKWQYLFGERERNRQRGNNDRKRSNDREKVGSCFHLNVRCIMSSSSPSQLFVHDFLSFALLPESSLIIPLHAEVLVSPTESIRDYVWPEKQEQHTLFRLRLNLCLSREGSAFLIRTTNISPAKDFNTEKVITWQPDEKEAMSPGIILVVYTVVLCISSEFNITTAYTRFRSCLRLPCVHKKYRSIWWLNVDIEKIRSIQSRESTGCFQAAVRCSISCLILCLPSLNDGVNDHGFCMTVTFMATETTKGETNLDVWETHENWGRTRMVSEMNHA